MRTGIRILVAILAPLLTSCALRSDVTRLERQLTLQRLEAQRADSQTAANFAALARMAQSLADSLARQQMLLERLQGDVRVQLYDIQRQLVAVQELTGQSQQRLTELRSQLERRSVQLGIDSGSAAAPAAAVAGAPGGGEPSADQLLDLSLQQLRRGSPGAARAGLAEFLRRFPAHARAADAVLFTGEAWAAEQRNDSAAAAYRQLVQRWPTSPRAATALYRLGVMALAEGRGAEARASFERIVSAFPNSEEAPLARERLRTVPQR